MYLLTYLVVGGGEKTKIIYITVSRTDWIIDEKYIEVLHLQTNKTLLYVPIRTFD